MTDRVFIANLEVACVVGVHAWERHAPRTLLVDLELETDTKSAAATDEVADAVDYEAVAECVRSCADGARHRLLETLAEAIAQRVLAEHPSIAAVNLRITKPAAIPRAAGAGVAVRRERGGNG